MSEKPTSPTSSFFSRARHITKKHLCTPAIGQTSIVSQPHADHTLTTRYKAVLSSIRIKREDPHRLANTNLSPSDILLLTKALSIPPHAALPTISITSSQKYAYIINSLIDTLPLRLQNRSHPWFSPFCPAHKRLRVGVVKAIYQSMRWELQDGKRWKWIVDLTHYSGERGMPGLAGRLADLGEVGRLWSLPGKEKKGKSQEGGEGRGREMRRERHPEFVYLENGCVACVLAVLGSKPSTAMLIGAMILGGMDEASWGKDKGREDMRVQWCEGWIRAAFDDDEKGRLAADMWIREMYLAGSAMRAARKSAHNEEACKRRKREGKGAEFRKDGRSGPLRVVSCVGLEE